MLGSAAFRTGVAPGGALAGPWVRNPLWNAARSVPSLDLRFADNKSLVDATTGRNLVTFTRASSGTYVDSQGVIRTATTNLQRHSEDFTQGLTPNNATLTANQGLAPNGTITADQFLETTANGLHSQEIVDHAFIAGATYTFSCYAKSIGERNFAPGFPTLFSSARFGFFNLSGSGSVVSTNAGVTASIQAVGDGWYRCSITSTCVTGGGARVGVFIASGTSISYVGDAAKGLLLWGAQLEQSSTVGEYIPTGTTINSAPRFDHNPTTGESLGLLVEEQRTNLLVRSEEFDNASWSKSQSSVSSNTATSPAGTLTADSLVENTQPGLQHYTTQTVTISANTVYTATVYVKANTRSSVRFGFLNSALSSGAFAHFNVSTGAISTQTTAGTASNVSFGIEAAASGWYRCRVTCIVDNSSTTGTFFVGLVDGSNNATYTGDGTSGVYIWGAQLEAGAFPTSYIPTTTSAATRSADVASISGSNFSGWYRQDEGTVFADCLVSAAPVNAGQNIWGADDDTSNNRIYLGKKYDSSTQLEFGVTAGGVGQAFVLTTPSSMASRLVAASYKVDSFANVAKGGSVGTDTSGSVPAVDRLRIGRLSDTNELLNGTIRRLTYWPARLSNNVLQELTR